MGEVMARGGKREGAGRPKGTIKGALPTRSIRCSDEEYLKIKEFLKQLRGQ